MKRTEYEYERARIKSMREAREENKQIRKRLASSKRQEILGKAFQWFVLASIGLLIVGGIVLTLVALIKYVFYG